MQKSCKNLLVSVSMIRAAMKMTKMAGYRLHNANMSKGSIAEDGGHKKINHTW